MGKRNRDKSSNSEDSDHSSISQKELLKRLSRLERKIKKKRHHYKRHSHTASPASLDRDRSDDERRRHCYRPKDRSSTSHRSRGSPDDRLQRETAFGRGSPRSTSQGFTEDHSLRGMASPQNIECDEAVLQLENDIILDDDIMQILGDDPEQIPTKIPEVNEAIVTRWNYMLKNGITLDDKTKLRNQYKFPSNLELTPPEVNQELVPILTPIHKKRDQCYLEFQNEIGYGLTALSTGLNVILEHNENIPKDIREKILTPLWNAGRIFTNLNHEVTQTRRNLLIPLLNKSVKEIAEKTNSTNLLFGEGLGEKIKCAKILEKTGKELLGQNPIPKTPRSAGPREREGAKRISNYSGNRYRPTRFRRESKPFKGRPSRETYNYPNRKKH